MRLACAPTDPTDCSSIKEIEDHGSKEEGREEEVRRREGRTEEVGCKEGPGEEEGRGQEEVNERAPGNRRPFHIRGTLLPAPPLHAVSSANLHRVLLLRHADVHAPRPLGLQSLLLGGGRILWMGPDNHLPALPAALADCTTEIDLAGLRLIPGLIDGHVHVTGGGGEAGFSTRVPAVPLSRYTLAGVTTVVGLLGTDDVTRGPRDLLAQVYALREEGLNAYGYAGGYHVPLATLTASVRTDLALLEPLLGIGEVAISDHRSSQPTFDEILRLAADAHVAGLMTGKAGILHLHLGDGPRGLELVRRALRECEIPARVFNPTHVNRRKALFEEAVDLARAGCTIDLTAFPVDDDEDA